jgi:carbon storage regulator
VLIVRRRAGQAIVIAGEVEIEILEISSNKVKLGIVGPKTVSVLRKEFGLTIQANQAARTITPALRVAIVDKLSRIAQMENRTADKSSEEDTSGIPSRENLNPA